MMVVLPSRHCTLLLTACLPAAACAALLSTFECNAYFEVTDGYAALCLLLLLPGRHCTQPADWLLLLLLLLLLRRTSSGTQANS